MLAAYRWQYIVSGVQEPRFQKILGGMVSEAQMAAHRRRAHADPGQRRSTCANERRRLQTFLCAPLASRWLQRRALQPARQPRARRFAAHLRRGEPARSAAAMCATSRTRAGCSRDCAGWRLTPARSGAPRSDRRRASTRTSRRLPRLRRDSRRLPARPARARGRRRCSTITSATPQSQLRRHRPRAAGRGAGTMPGYHAVLAMHAYALQECGAYEEAEAAAQRALALQPRDVRAHHALAHVMEMQGRWRRACAGWAHAARCGSAQAPLQRTCGGTSRLYHLELGRRRRRSRIYDHRLQGDSFSELHRRLRRCSGGCTSPASGSASASVPRPRAGRRMPRTRTAPSTIFTR